MYKHILLPVAPENVENARKELIVAKRLLHDEGRLTLLTVLEPAPSYVAHLIPEKVREEIARETAATLTSLADGAPHILTKTATGLPGRTIVDHAERNGVDLVVIASHVPGPGDIIFGSTAAWVVRHCGCSVHVIR